MDTVDQGLTTSDEPRDELAELRQRVASLEAALERISSGRPVDVRHPVGTPAPDTGGPPSDRAPSDGAGSVSRRGMLVGGVGAAVAGTVALVAGASPAAANSQGQSWALGDPNNTATDETGLTGNFTNKPVVGVWNQGSAAAVLGTLNTATFSSLTAAVVGQSDGYNGVGGQSKDGYGVVGLSANSCGVYATGATAGVSGNSGDTGVYGQGTNIGVSGSGTFGVVGQGANTGVQGTSTAGFGVKGDGGTGTGVSGDGALLGVSGSSTGGTGVIGQSTAAAGTGVVGQGHTGVAGLGDSVGVSGQTNDGTAVWGQSTTGIGVKGVSTSAAGLYGSSQSAPGAQLVSDFGQLSLQVATPSRPAPTADVVAHQVGELVRDGAGALWYCVGAGTPGTWRQVSDPAAAGAFHVLPAPARVYDSRPFTTPGSIGPKTPLPANTARVLDTTANSSGVPAGATAVVCNLLLVNTVGGGNFTVWANGVTRPLGNSMVWGGTAGRFSSLAVSAVDAAGKVQVYASTKTDLVLDIVGYYR